MDRMLDEIGLTFQSCSPLWATPEQGLGARFG
jgi:hypothetical protein